jgi:regulator of sirC expression with transglutaminase-like and TPR domain
VTALAADDLAGALFAIEGASRERREITSSCLSGWADSVRALVVGGMNPATALGETLVEGAGLVGDTESYFAEENSHLSRVVERRRGLPILLSAVWMLVGKGAGIDVRGIGLPGHFLVGVEGSYLDPFHGGRELALRDCRELVATLHRGTVTWRNDMLDAVSVPAMVQRVLRNLLREHTRQDDKRAMFRCVMLLCELLPSDPSIAMSRAELANELGDRVEHRLALHDIVARFPGSEAAAIAARRLASIGLPS